MTDLKELFNLNLQLHANSIKLEKENVNQLTEVEDDDIESEIEDIDDGELELDDDDIEGDDDTPKAEEVEINIKKYDDSEVNSIVDRRLARERRKHERELQEKEDRLNRVLGVIQAGTGTESPDEGIEYLTDYWKGQGIQLPEDSKNEITGLNEKQIKLLATNEAEEYISSGLDDVIDEVERLAEIGTDNMSNYEIEKFKILAQHRLDSENAIELQKIGVTEDILTTDDFKEFRKKFSNATSISEVYDYYAKVNNITTKDNFEIMGSQKSNGEVKVKEYYTDAEIDKLTDKDLDNEEVYNAVVRSMAINYKKK